MTRWMRSLLATLDAVRGRWVPFVAETADDVDGVLRVMDVVRRQELRRVAGASAKETAAFDGAEVDDRLVGVRDGASGQVVACLRILMAPEVQNTDAANEYRLVDMPPHVLATTAIFTRLAVLPDFRQTAAGVTAMRHAARVALETWSAHMLVFTCEPGLYPLYRRLGFRPLGRIHLSASGAYRIPMLGLFDGAHLARMTGPLRKDAEAFAGGVSEPLAAWYSSLQIADGGDIDVGVELLGPEDAPDVAITRGMTPAGRKALLKNAVRLNPARGEGVVRAGDGGRNLYVVESGVLGAMGGSTLYGTTSEGDVFGEMSLLLGRPRTADVVALTDDVQVLVLSQRALDRLDDPADQAVLWRAVAGLLARRLLGRQLAEEL